VNSRFNTANLAALGPILTTLLVIADVRFDWGMGDVFMTAAAAGIMWILTSITPDKGYVYRPETITPLIKSSILGPVIMILLIAGLLGGCTMVPYYSQLKAVADTGIATAIEDRKEYNDKKLASTVAILCDNSIGAVGRYPEGDVKDFLTGHCLGSGAQISIDQLMSVLDFINKAKQPRTGAPVLPDGPEGGILPLPQS
jgi:hypothetical protein